MQINTVIEHLFVGTCIFIISSCQNVLIHNKKQDFIIFKQNFFETFGSTIKNKNIHNWKLKSYSFNAFILNNCVIFKVIYTLFLYFIPIILIFTPY